MTEEIHARVHLTEVVERVLLKFSNRIPLLSFQLMMNTTDRYVAALKLFRKKSSVRKVIMDYAQNVAAHTMRNLTKDCLKSSEFRVLGVGSGHGQTDLRILTAIATAIESSEIRRPVIHTTVIEPSPMIEEFKTSVLSLPRPLKDLAEVSFEWHEMTLQNLMEGPSNIERFDVVHFVASLYYMEAETALRYCYEHLVSGGAIFCTVLPEDSFFPKLSRKLHGRINLGLAQKLYTEVDIVNIAKRNNWKYEELWKTHYTADISSCFDESSKEGGFLLDFLTHLPDFRDTADSMIYKDVMEFLNEESTIDENGKKFIKPEITAVVIYK